MSSARKRDRIARVSTTDEVWAEFRGLGDNRSIGERLGELVEREVRRKKRAEIRRGAITDREAVEAITEAREIQRDLDSLVAQLELSPGDGRGRATAVGGLAAGALASWYGVMARAEHGYSRCAVENVRSR